MGSEADFLKTWHDLYVMLGTSSAALIGLLFVATSLHLKEFASDAVYRLRAQYTSLILVGTLMQAMVILTPQPEQFVGIELVAANLFGIWLPINLLRKASTISETRRRGGFSVRRAAFFLSANAIGMVGSIALIAGGGWGLYLVTICYAGCVVATIWNAWMIMLGIGQSGKRRAR